MLSLGVVLLLLWMLQEHNNEYTRYKRDHDAAMEPDYQGDAFYSFYE